MICGWCHGAGEVYGKKCICQEAKRPYFPKKKKSRFGDDRLASGHKHDFASVVSTGSTYEWWECSCGHVYKVVIP